MQDIEILKAEQRTNLGTGAARALRNNKKIPAIIYGRNNPVALVYLDQKETTYLYDKKMFSSKIIEIELENKVIRVVAKKVDLHPVKGTIMHIDFIYLNNDYQLMNIPVRFMDNEKSPGVKKGGFFNIALRTIKISCPVDKIPTYLPFNAGAMYIGNKIKASDVHLPEGAKLITPAKTIIASIVGKSGKEEAPQGTEAASSTDKK